MRDLTQDPLMVYAADGSLSSEETSAHEDGGEIVNRLLAFDPHEFGGRVQSAPQGC